MTDYRDLLKIMIDEKLAKPSRLSLRGLAIKCGVSHSLLSQVMARRRHLSKRTALRIAAGLGMSSDQTQVFTALIESETGTSPSSDRSLQTAADKIKKQKHALLMAVDQFTVIADWYHLPILELARCHETSGLKKEHVVHELHLTAKTASLALQRLVRLKLLQKSGDRYFSQMGLIKTGNQGSHQAIRNFHRSMIEKAKLAIEDQSLDERHLSGLTLAMSRADFTKLQTIIEAFKNSLPKKLANSKSDCVYQINFQAFCLANAKEELS